MAFIPLTADQAEALGETALGKPVDRDPASTRHLKTNAVIASSQDNLVHPNYLGHEE